MKKRLTALALLLTFMLLCLSGCGIVTVVKIGEEDSLIGGEKTDIASEAGGAWEAVSGEITEKAVELSEAEGTGALAVKGTGVIAAVDRESKKGTVTLTVDGFTEKTVLIAIGPVYNGTAVRDVQTQKAYTDFVNQSEWSEYALALNTMVNDQVVTPAALDSDAVGKTLSFVGACGQMTGDTITIIPVALTVE